MCSLTELAVKVLYLEVVHFCKSVTEKSWCYPEREHVQLVRLDRIEGIKCVEAET
jgi:hypothetical protein